MSAAIPNQPGNRDASDPGGSDGLRLENIHVYYGGVHALKGISLHVQPGEIVALIGANGAGKSTCLKTISGLLHPRQGSVMWRGRQIGQMKAHRIVALGIAHCPEGRRLVPTMSVRENLDMGGYLRPPAELRHTMEEVLSYFPQIAPRLSQLAGTMSGGEQQMVAIMRGLMAQPRLLLLDEPSLGLSPKLTDDIFTRIPQIAAGNVGILLVEQNASLALQISQRGYVMETGSIVRDDRSANLAADTALQAAYLGIG
jgi:branched-chain amino acid transport system ATP-binding protein